MKILTALIFTTLSLNAFSFDLTDYEGTYVATRNAYKTAYNASYLAEQSYIAVFDQYKTVGFINPAGTSKSGLGLNSCTHLKACKDARARAKVLPKVAAIGADSRLASYITLGEVARLSGEITDYYDKFDEDLITSQEILFEEQSDESVTYMELGIDNTRYGIKTWSGSPDIDDLHSDLRAKRDAYLSASNQLKLARAPYLAAQAGYAAALENYFNYFNCSGWGPAKSMEELVNDGDI